MAKFGGGFFLVAGVASIVTQAPSSLTIACLGIAGVVYALSPKKTIQR